MRDQHKVSETSFHKNTIYQGRGTEMRKINKENKDARENNKTET